MNFEKALFHLCSTYWKADWRFEGVFLLLVPNHQTGKMASVKAQRSGPGKRGQGCPTSCTCECALAVSRQLYWCYDFGLLLFFGLIFSTKIPFLLVFLNPKHLLSRPSTGPSRPSLLLRRLRRLRRPRRGVFGRSRAVALLGCLCLSFA